MTILISFILHHYRGSAFGKTPPFLAASATGINVTRDNAISPAEPLASNCSCPDLRSIWDITWSCLATVFACSWVSVHPDIPAVGQTRFRIALRRLEYMIWTVLTPEMVILWAARQWFGARDIAKFDYGSGITWTRTHGHFLQMGGFVLYKGKEPRGVLCHPRFKYLLDTGRIAFPEVTAEEILDRSKSDNLSKILVVGQTAWFILQCMVRGCKGLSTTGLELATLAFAALNAFMYIFWWDKPFDVQTPIPVQLIEKRFHREMMSNDTVQYGADSKSALSSSNNKRPPYWMWRAVQAISHRLYSLKENAFQIHEFEEYFERLRDTSHPRTDIDYSKLIELPPYYARMTSLEDETTINVFIAIIAMLFGCIHCSGWYFYFPSIAELWIWRTCSLLISSIPVCYIAAEALWKAREYTSYGLQHYDTLQQLYKGFHYIFSYVCVPLYILARIAIVVDVFAAMRNLPLEVYIDVDWVSYIPHV